MAKMEVTVELDNASLNQIQTLAMKKGISVENEAICLLEKGIVLCEENNTPEKPG